MRKNIYLLPIITIFLTACSTNVKTDVIPTPAEYKFNKPEFKDISDEIPEIVKIQEDIPTIADISVVEDIKADIIPSDNIYNSAYLVDRLYERTGENVIFSPMSLDMAMGMVEHGGSEYAQELIGEFLGQADYDRITADILSKCNSMDVDDEEILTELQDEIYTLLENDGLSGLFDAANAADFSLYLAYYIYYMDKLSDYGAWSEALNEQNTYIDKKTANDIKEYYSHIEYAKTKYSNGIEWGFNVGLCDEDGYYNTLMLQEGVPFYNVKAGIEEIRKQLKYKTDSSFLVANSFWYDQRYDVFPEFLSETKDIYQAKAEHIDMSDPKQSSNIINSWCSDKTNGKINDIISPDLITDETAMLLVNSVYFNSPWKDRWTRREDEFTNFEGNTEKTDMIHGNADRYYENDRAIAFGKEYKNRFVFIGILPKNEGEFNIRDLNIKDLLENEKTGDYTDIYAHMPVISCETTNNDIADDITSMGLSGLFEDKPGVLDRLMQYKDGRSKNAYIDKIIQKCTIDLDEYGTEASAVTVIQAMYAGAAVMEEKKTVTVTLNRPFAYCIIEPDTGEIVFMGKYVKP